VTVQPPSTTNEASVASETSSPARTHKLFGPASNPVKAGTEKLLSHESQEELSATLNQPINQAHHRQTEPVNSKVRCDGCYLCAVAAFLGIPRHYRNPSTLHMQILPL
jgi:hypothetical protein